MHHVERAADDAGQIEISSIRRGGSHERHVTQIATARRHPVGGCLVLPARNDRSVQRTRAHQPWFQGDRRRPARRGRPNDLARAFAAALGHPVSVEIVPRETWEGIFRAQGTRKSTPRIRMIDGFNEGRIDFADQGRAARKGSITIESVITEMVAASRGKSAA